MNDWLALLEAASVRDSRIVMLDKTTHVGKAHPHVKEGIEKLSIIMTEVINPVPA